MFIQKLILEILEIELMLERTLIPLQINLSRYILVTVFETVLTALSDFMLEMNRCLRV